MLIFNFKSTTPIFIQEFLAKAFREEPDVYFAISRPYSAKNIIAQDVGLPLRIPGQLAPEHLIELKISLAMVGHLERRIHLNEDLKTVKSKMMSALRCGIVPILCNGLGSPEDCLEELEDILKQVPLDNYDIVIAHEHIASTVSGGAVVDEATIAGRIALIHNRLQSIQSSGIRFRYKLLYGGGVTPEIIKNLHGADLDGFLVGDRYRTHKEVDGLVQEYRNFASQTRQRHLSKARSPEYIATGQH